MVAGVEAGADCRSIAHDVVVDQRDIAVAADQVGLLFENDLPTRNLVARQVVVKAAFALCVHAIGIGGDEKVDVARRAGFGPRTATGGRDGAGGAGHSRSRWAPGAYKKQKTTK